jgi:3',5'-cyclic AMP phosphodiesterase CpdA
VVKCIFSNVKLLICSDLHFHRPWFEWLSARSLEFDACCVPGDLLDMFKGATCGLRQQSRWVRGWLANFPGVIFLSSGNHDFWPKDPRCLDNDSEGGWLRKAQRDRVFADGSDTVFSGHRFVCCPWGSTIEPQGDEPVVMLHHQPPDQLAVAAGSSHGSGDADLARTAWLLPEGSFILSGHVHAPRRFYDRGGRTWCFNAGSRRSNVRVPNHIVIDTGLNTAELFTEDSPSAVGAVDLLSPAPFW